MTTLACVAPDRYVGNSEDCNDASSAISPVNTEICDGIDNSCSGAIDDVVGGCTFTLADPPRGCGSDAGECQAGIETCTPAGTWGPCVGAVVGSAETCDGRDNDCDGNVDEDPGLLNTFYRDDDGDGFGAASMTTLACSPRTGYSDRSGDCNDSNVQVFAGGPERCNGVDNDCDGTVDDSTNDGPALGVIPHCRDVDGDGFGSGAETFLRCPRQPTGLPPVGYSTSNGHCVDTTGSRSALVYPGAGFQTAPRCGGGPTSCTNPFGGAPGCVNSFGLCDSPTWDYDCDGVVTRQQPSCAWSCEGFCACVGGRAPTTTPTVGCGSSVLYGRCCGTTSMTCGPSCDIATEPLGCR